MYHRKVTIFIYIQYETVLKISRTISLFNMMPNLYSVRLTEFLSWQIMISITKKTIPLLGKYCHTDCNFFLFTVTSRMAFYQSNWKMQGNINDVFLHYLWYLMSFYILILNPCIQSPCNNAATKSCNSLKRFVATLSCNATYTLKLLLVVCMIVLHQTSLITLETVATFCCSTVARWVYGGL